jgi:hypothetical protein
MDYNRLIGKSVLYEGGLQQSVICGQLRRGFDQFPYIVAKPLPFIKDGLMMVNHGR